MFQRTPRWLRLCSLTTATAFTWTTLCALPVQVYALHLTRESQFARAISALLPASALALASRRAALFGGTPLASPRSGDAFPWEVASGGVNTATGNKLTSLSVVGFPVRGELSVGLSFVHNSESTRTSSSSPLGAKWSHSYDVFLTQPSANLVTLHRGDDLSLTFTKSAGNIYTSPTGFFETLSVDTGTGLFTLTTKDQVQYAFNSALKLASITDRSGNTVSLAYTGGVLTSIADPTGTRSLTLSYNAGNTRITQVTDSLNRAWTLTYDASGRLIKVNKPLLSGQSVAKFTGFTYDANNNLATVTSPAGRVGTYSYNTDGSVLWQKDGVNNETDFNYSSLSTDVVDANGHAVTYAYTGGRTTSISNAGVSTLYTYNAQNLVTQITDRRGKVWSYTYSPDLKGNLLTETDPLNVTTTYTYTAKNDVANVSQPIDGTCQ